jgi:hypothetical protein
MHKKQNLCEMQNKLKVPNKILFINTKFNNREKNNEIKESNYIHGIKEVVRIRL